jgi:hypothetical protein
MRCHCPITDDAPLIPDLLLPFNRWAEIIMSPITAIIGTAFS